MFLRIEIERMRVQIRRQRFDIQNRAGISTTASEELLMRMQNKTDELSAERDRQVGEARVTTSGLTR